MQKLQFRVLYRQFLFRIVDLELLSAHAEGDSRTLLGQFASLLIYCSVILAALAGIWAANVRNDRVPPLTQLTGAWTMEHFLIATTMLTVGLFAVLSWDSTFPDRRDVLVLGPLPIPTRTLFLAKVAAVASALGLTLAALHLLAGIAWPLALAQYDSAPAPALVFDPSLPPVRAADFPAVMNRDIAPLLQRLAPVSVAPAGPIRAFFAYWIAMLAAGTFMFCCVLAVQGIAAQFLPRRCFLRVSAFLQMAVFCLLVTGYFLQKSPSAVLMTGPRQSWISWIPSYWFAGLYRQLSGSLHPALAPFARRAWLGLLVAVVVTAAAYAASYLRTLRKIVEAPDIAPGYQSRWLPRLGGSFENALAQFSIRSLLRSRHHRMIYAFYLGVGFALAILFLKAPPEIVGPPPSASDPWGQFSVPLLASTIMLMGLWVVGARAVFSLPLDLSANWIFRIMPLSAGSRCLRGRRRALYVLSVAPAWALSAACLVPVWPWRPAVAHLAMLGLLGIILAEFSFAGTQKIPFTCSYLPGKSKFHMIFWLWFLLVAVVLQAAGEERKALESPAASIAILASLGIVAGFCVLRSNWQARSNYAELRFEEEPSDRLLTLDL